MRFSFNDPLKWQIVAWKQLLMLLKSGRSIHESLEIITASSQHLVIQRLMRSFRKQLNSGESLLMSLQLTTSSSPIFAGIASVEIPNVSQCVSDWITHLENQWQAQQRLIKAIRYPAVLMMLLVLMGSLFVIIFIPMMSSMMHSLSLPLPSFFGVLDTVTQPNHWIREWGVTVAVGWMVWGLMAMSYSNQYSRLSLQRQLRQILFWYYMGLRSGMSLDDCLQSMKLSASHPCYSAYEGFVVRLKKTGHIADSLAQYFPLNSMDKLLLESSQNDGSLIQSLGDLIDRMDERFSRTVDLKLACVQPLLLCLISICLGGMMYGVFSPFLSMVSQFE